MISELRKDKQMNMLSVRDIYDYPTIRELAGYIDSLSRNTVNKETEKNLNKKVKPLTFYSVAVLQILALIFFYGIATILITSPLLICLLYTSPSPRDRTRSR